MTDKQILLNFDREAYAKRWADVRTKAEGLERQAREFAFLHSISEPSIQKQLENLGSTLAYGICEIKQDLDKVSTRVLDRLENLLEIDDYSVQKQLDNLAAITFYHLDEISGDIDKLSTRVSDRLDNLYGVGGQIAENNVSLQQEKLTYLDEINRSVYLGDIF